jgi:crotonobetainyl-CoA:carnitine CoA-transferase CaiB-like acyl-CoA transferase
VELAVAHKVPVAPVCDGRTVAELEQVKARGTLVKAPSGRFIMPGRPWRIDGDPGPAPKAAPPGPVTTSTDISWHDSTPAAPVSDASADRPAPGRALDGLRVVDLTSWWAGPMSSAFLAAFGAEVIHIESPSRMDGMRMVGATFFDRPRWWELSWFFLSINSNKRDVALEIDTERGHELARQLIAEADVVIENATPRVLDKLGLGWDTIQAANPRAILVRMPAFGLDGPWRERPGFAQTIEQASGLAWMTGRADDQPRIQRGPCDPNGGVHAAIALCVALQQRERTGRGCIVEASMFDAALAIAAEPIIEWSAYGYLLARDGNRSAHAAPQGLYACTGDDAWLAVSVETDEQWEALATAIGAPDLAGDPQLATRAGRRAMHDRLDALIGAWAAPQNPDTAAAALVAAGVPAAISRDPRTVARHPQFVARGFHETIDHPVAGRLPVSTLPLRVDGVERWLRTYAPCFGADNAYVLGDVLGLAPDAIDALRAANVIAEQPAGF